MKYSKAFRLILLLLFIGGLAMACQPYRINVLQGNFIEEETVDQIEIGMTRRQVQFLMGTPAIQDPFHVDRWDYVYHFRQGKTGRVSQLSVAVFFEGDSVIRVERKGFDDLDEAAS